MPASSRFRHASPLVRCLFLGPVLEEDQRGRAITALMGGFVLDVGRFVAEINRENLAGVLATFVNINLMYVEIFLFLICCGLLVGVSLASKPPPRDQIKGFHYVTLPSENRRVSRESWKLINMFQSILIVSINVTNPAVFFSLGIPTVDRVPPGWPSADYFGCGQFRCL